MRLPLLALAALAALAPSAGRGEDAPLPPIVSEARRDALEAEAQRGGEPVKVPAALESSRPAAVEQERRVQDERLEARAVSLPLPAATEREGAEARAALAMHRARSGMPRWGLALGGGFPDFANASLVFRPVSHVRLSAGPSWDYVGWGVQGGVALVPWNFWIAPVVSLEAGRFFRTNLGFLAKDSGGVPAEVKPLLEKIDYSYAALDVGLEVGSQRGFSSSIRLGLSYVSIATRGTATYTTDSGTVVSMTNPALHGTLPSLKVGFQYWF